MKRFLLFGGDQFYPAGGWGDLKGSADTLEQALLLDRRRLDWWHIVDTEVGIIIHAGTNGRVYSAREMTEKERRNVPPERTMTNDRWDALIDRDWSDVWETLPEAPGVVPRGKTAQVTLRLPSPLLARIKRVARLRALKIRVDRLKSTPYLWLIVRVWRDGAEMRICRWRVVARR